VKTFTNPDLVPLPEDTTHHTKIKNFINDAYGWMDSYKGQPVQVIWNIETTWSNVVSKNFKSSSYLCHYHYVGGCNDTTQWTYNAFTTQTSKNHCAYIEWLVSDDSPYRKLFEDDLCFLLRDEKTGRPVLIGTTDFQKLPIALWTNFLIASRLSAGWALSHIWSYLIDNGFTKHEAIAIAVWFHFSCETVTINTTRDGRHLDSFRRNYSLSCGSPNSSDQPYNYRDKAVSVKRLADGAPLPHAFKTFTKGGSMNPCNNIWDDSIRIFQRNTTSFIDTYTKSQVTIQEAFNKNQPLDPAFVASVKKHIEEKKSVV
jgi:hypothetical protein